MMRLARRIVGVMMALVVLIGVPAAILVYQSHRSGMTISQIVRRSVARAAKMRTGLEGQKYWSLPKGEKIDFLQMQPIGAFLDLAEPPRISYLETVDLDKDGLLDVLVCDCLKDRITWIRHSPRGVFREHVLATGIPAPAHVQAVNFTGRSGLDLVVACLGMLFPNNDPIGSVVILENVGPDEHGVPKFVPHVVIERTARVADARAGDFNGDGRLDLAVAQFGYDDGQTQWLENLGNWQFKSHIWQTISGPIHCPIADLDSDGNLDVVVLVSQEWEEIWVYVGDGHGNFKPKRIFGSDNEDFGSSGLWLYDLNQDGKLDILYTNGDAFDYMPPRPRPWHGIQWFENKGNFAFEFHRVADVPGAVNAVPLDINHDGHLDLVVVSEYHQWENPEAQSMIWLENDGAMHFKLRDLATMPTHIQALACGDFDGDGEIDLVTGGLHVYPPYDRMERVALWWNQWPNRTPVGAR